MTEAVGDFAAGLWPSRSLAVLEVGRDGVVSAANGPAAEIARGDPVGRDLAELAAPAQRPALENLVSQASDEWTGMTVGLAPDSDGVPVDFEIWARRSGDRVLVVAEPQLHGVAALNSELLRLNDELVAARRDAARLADSEHRARGRAEATALRLRNLQQIVDTTLAELSLDDLLDELLSRLSEAVGAEAIEALLLDEDAGRLAVRADRGLAPRGRDDMSFPTDRGLPGDTLRAGEVRYLRPVTADAGVSRALSEGVRSLVSVPLRASGRPIGVLLLGTQDDRAFSGTEIEMLELAADRIGTAIERVMAFERERTVAAILQDSLMPGDIPDLPGVEVATRYRPAGVGHRVGGDFYDVFGLTGDRCVTVVGDVRGKGPEAAARTALVRFTIRALAPRERSPAALLGELNRQMLEQGDVRRRHCSVVYASFVPRAGGGLGVELASGGHPPAQVLRAGGGVEPFGGPGSLIGLVGDVTHRDEHGELAPGELIVFYTDGVSEARREGELFGEERIAQLLADSRGMTPAAVAERVERAAADFSDGPLRDDIAIVAVRAA